MRYNPSGAGRKKTEGNIIGKSQIELNHKEDKHGCVNRVKS